MKFLNLIYKNNIILFFLILFLILLIKFFCVSPLNQNTFLTNYKFFTPDSYDWIANGVDFFKSKDISYRNPGLPFIIFIFYNLNVLYLLPLLNYIAFLCLLVFVYKTIKFFTKENFFSVLGVLFIFLNYSFQDFSNYILADFYAIAFLSVSLYFLLTKKDELSFFILGLSAIFQNFAFFVLPLWFIYLFILNFDKNNLIKSQIRNLKKYIYNFLFFFVLPGSWFLYKFILFGNPFYTKVTQFGLLSPNLNLLFYYLINSLSLFGLIIFYFKNIFNKKRNWNFIFLTLVLIYIFSFWTFLYYWADRRFLFYLIPFIYPLIFCLIKENFRKKIIFKVIFLFLFLYPTTISLGRWHVSNIIPITNWYKLEFSVHGDEGKRHTVINFPLEFKSNIYSKKQSLFPAMTEIVFNRNYNLYNQDTIFNKYSNDINRILNNNYCIDVKLYSSYELSAITQIVTNNDYNDLSLRNSSNCKNNIVF